jgi:hypothetical protein
MSVLIRFCLIDGIKKSFNIKVEKGNVLMRNLKDLVGTEDFLSIWAQLKPHWWDSNIRRATIGWI